MDHRMKEIEKQNNEQILRNCLRPEKVTVIAIVVGALETIHKNLEKRRDKLKMRGAYDKFPDFFRMGTFIDSTHMKI